MRAYTLKDLLCGKGSDAMISSVVVPMIQRDYAQGRKNNEAERVRRNFLDVLHEKLVASSSAPLILDFVYGSVNEKGEFTPLDGQQRLTTLYLLYWYAGVKEKKTEVMSFLKNFSYETRYSTRDFCEKLTAFCDVEIPDREPELSEVVKDQEWFLAEWEKDPTVSSMLVMLDAIQEKFSDVKGMWEKLDRIQFHLLSMKDMGLTDELYIKMNSRGKQLTMFEHFKAQLTKQLKEYSDVVADKILWKIDVDWTDMLWKYHGGNHLIDEEFLKYFKFVCDVIYYREYDREGSYKDRTYDEFELLKRYFSKDKSGINAQLKEHIMILRLYFSCWRNLQYKGNSVTPSELIAHFISEKHAEEKIICKKDVFTQCLNGYADQNRRQFSLSEFLLLYAFVQYCLHRDIGETLFARRLRIVNNLINNSENEIRDDGGRAKNIYVMMRQIERIIFEGKIDKSIGHGFNDYQLDEEKAKLDWTEDKDRSAAECEELFQLEDHELLYGQISILCRQDDGSINLVNLKLSRRFADLFNCDWDMVDRALMCKGYYGQRDSWRYQFGTKDKKYRDPWQVLFHYRNNDEEYKKTQKALLDLLLECEHGDYPLNDVLKDFVKYTLEEWDRAHKYSWRYYYVKYAAFRKGFYGKCCNVYEHPFDPDKDDNYMFYVMTTRYRTSAFTYVPYLQQAYDDLHEDKSIDHPAGSVSYNQLRWGDKIIECCEEGYKVNGKNDDSLTFNPGEGFDKKDRVEELVKYLKGL